MVDILSSGHFLFHFLLLTSPPVGLMGATDDMALYVVASCVLGILALLGVGMSSTASHASTSLAVILCIVAAAPLVLQQVGPPTAERAARTTSALRVRRSTRDGSARVATVQREEGRRSSTTADEVVRGDDEDEAAGGAAAAAAIRPPAAAGTSSEPPPPQWTYAGQGSTQDMVDTHMVVYVDALKPHGMNRSAESWLRLRSAMFRDMVAASTTAGAAWR